VREIAKHAALGGRGWVVVGSPEEVADDVTNWITRPARCAKSSLVQVARGSARIIQRRGSAVLPTSLAADKPGLRGDTGNELISWVAARRSTPILGRRGG
jgi:hypothetical protein